MPTCLTANKKNRGALSNSEHNKTVLCLPKNDLLA